MKLVAEGITKSWGATHVLRGLDFTAEPGSLTALTGANGTGKTTFIRVLATILRPDDGSLSLGELGYRSDALKVRGLIGYLGHESMLDAAMTMRENLNMFGRLYGLADAASRASDLIQRFEATAFADLPISELSRGQEQTAALSRALMHDPRLLLLDEPSTGLDKSARGRLWQAAREQAKAGAVVIFSTHDHDSAADVADRVVEMRDGKIHPTI
ncbi:MAG: ABC transporter ATP-binding protein [Planctomycetes bacterium]|nr:ABC transporter ATP-binding protein [Planctomycetota bacterium]